MHPSNQDHFSPQIATIIGSKIQTDVRDITWLAGDGSDRKYYRIHTTKPITYVLMLLSETDGALLEKNQYDWLAVCKVLHNQKIRVPEVIACIPEFRALVIEDYGNIMLETQIMEQLKSQNIPLIKNTYRLCFGILEKMLRITSNKDSTVWIQRAFDVEKYLWELRFFNTKFVKNVAHISLDRNDSELFENECNKIAEFLAPYSKYFVHRDLHSRNIMSTENGLALIDFQDARLGPAAYDLVSLIFDSYVPFNAALRSELFNEALNYLRSLGHDSICREIDATWKAVLLQRQLKAIGSFGYLTNDKNRGNYLKYVDPALKTLEDQNIADERWPFLSSVLLRKIRDYIDRDMK